MEKLSERFGRRVKELRKTKSLTQEELGHRSGVDFKFLGEIERGVKTTSFATIEKLAEALSVDYYQLFIPTARMTASIEKEINGLLSEAQRIEPAKIEEFLRGLRSLLRKLDRRDSSK